MKPTEQADPIPHTGRIATLDPKCPEATNAEHKLLAGIQTARNRYAGFFVLGCDCFAF